MPQFIQLHRRATQPPQSLSTKSPAVRERNGEQGDSFLPLATDATAAADLGWLPPEQRCPSLGGKQANVMGGVSSQSLTACGESPPHHQQKLHFREGSAGQRADSLEPGEGLPWRDPLVGRLLPRPPLGPGPHLLCKRRREGIHPGVPSHLGMGVVSGDSAYRGSPPSTGRFLR